MVDDNASPGVVPAFNLIDEPWLPVRWCNGGSTEVGLRKLFEHAADIVGIAEPSPPAFVALHRLLLAIAHRALTCAVGHWTTAERARWLREGLPGGALADYLERWGERFWLFHPTHPFMQVPELALSPETATRLKPWTQISLEHACGDAPVLFDHSTDNKPEPISASVAARLLIGYLQFVPGGLVKVLRTADRAGPLANTAAFIPTGDNLAETLVLGLHPSDIEGTDLPAWEQTAPTIADLSSPARATTGFNDLYTRVTRSCLFRADSDAGGCRIRQLWFAEGLAIEDNGLQADPAEALVEAKGGSVRPLRFAEGRAFWRELSALLPKEANRSSSHGPASLEWAQRLRGDIRFFVGGVTMAMKKAAKVERWRLEHFAWPAAVGKPGDAANALRGELSRAEALYCRLLALVARMTADAMPAPDSKITARRASTIAMLDRGEPASFGDPVLGALDRDRCAQAFFSVAGQAFPALVSTIGAGRYDDAFDNWSRTMADAARAAWAVAVESLGLSPRAVRAVALAQPRFHRLIGPLWPALSPSRIGSNSETHP